MVFKVRRPNISSWKPVRVEKLAGPMEHLVHLGVY